MLKCLIQRHIILVDEDDSFLMVTQSQQLRKCLQGTK